jgi:hypothetical protein
VETNNHEDRRENPNRATGTGSPRKMRKACHISTAVVKIGTQSTMMSSRKTSHEFSPHIPHKHRNGLISKNVERHSISCLLCFFVYGNF